MNDDYIPFAPEESPELGGVDTIFSIRGDLDGDIEEFTEERIQFIGMLIGKEEFLLPISAVNEIVMLTPITYVPQGPKLIDGVINLRGNILPVVNVRRMMGLDRPKVTPAARVVIVKHDEVIVGILVDGITYVVQLLPNQIENQSLTGKSRGAELISSIAKQGEKVIGILDLAKVVTGVSGGKSIDIGDEDEAS